MRNVSFYDHFTYLMYFARMIHLKLYYYIYVYVCIFMIKHRDTCCDADNEDAEALKPAGRGIGGECWNSLLSLPQARLNMSRQRMTEACAAACQVRVRVRDSKSLSFFELFEAREASEKREAVVAGAYKEAFRASEEAAGRAAAEALKRQRSSEELAAKEISRLRAEALELKSEAREAEEKVRKEEEALARDTERDLSAHRFFFHIFFLSISYHFI